MCNCFQEVKQGGAWEGARAPLLPKPRMRKRGLLNGSSGGGGERGGRRTLNSIKIAFLPSFLPSFSPPPGLSFHLAKNKLVWGVGKERLPSFLLLAFAACFFYIYVHLSFFALLLLLLFLLLFSSPLPNNASYISCDASLSLSLVSTISLPPSLLPVVTSSSSSFCLFLCVSSRLPSVEGGNPGLQKPPLFLPNCFFAIHIARGGLAITL